MRLPRFRLAAPLVFFLGVFVHYGHSSYFSSNSITFLTKIPLAVVLIAKDISAARVWVPNVPAGIPLDERDGSIKDEYYEVSNAFAKPGSKIVQEEEVISDQPYPWISLDEEWRLAHLQSPYVLRKKKGNSKSSVSSKQHVSSDENSDDLETEDGEEQTATSSSDEAEDEEVPIASSVEAEEEEEFEQVPDEDNEEEQDDVVPQEYLNNEESADYSAQSPGPPLPPPQNEESEENGADSDEEDEESEDDDNSSSASKVPLQALSHTGVEEEDDSTETNLELIPEEVKEAIVREMAKQYAKQARISATQIKKKVTTSKPGQTYSVKEENRPEIVRVSDPSLTNSHGNVGSRVTNSDGPFTEHGGGGGKGKGKKNKGKGKGKGKQGHGWRPPPKIWHPPPQYHKPHKHVRDGLLEQWTKGSQWERIIHSYHDYKDQQDYDKKHGKGDPHEGAGPLHRKPGLAESLLKGSFWERAFITYSNYKQKQQNKGTHEMAGEGWAPYDR